MFFIIDLWRHVKRHMTLIMTDKRNKVDYYFFQRRSPGLRHAEEYSDEDSDEYSDEYSDEDSDDTRMKILIVGLTINLPTRMKYLQIIFTKMFMVMRTYLPICMM